MEAESKFGVSRSTPAKVVIDSICGGGDACGSRYDAGQDEITIEKHGDPQQSQTFWGKNGAFSAAHEYGHAFQNKALGGMFDKFADGCLGHEFDKVTTMGCAVSEGFANWFAPAVRGSHADPWNTEDAHTVVDGRDGAKIEGAVAAFLFDITDDDSGEAWDDIDSWPISYVGI